MRKKIWYFFCNPHWPFKFFKDLIAPVAKIAGIALAPFTGGASLAATASISAIEGIDAQKKAKQQAEEQARQQQQQQQQQAQVASNQIINPDSIVSGQGISTRPIVVNLPSPMPLPLPAAPIQQRQGFSTPLLFVGFGLVAVIIIARR